MTIKKASEHLRAEFFASPEHRVTAAEVQAMCDLDAPTTETILDTLVNAHVLCANADGTYSRTNDWRIARVHPASVALKEERRHRKAS